jgi:hypothetical protein
LRELGQQAATSTLKVNNTGEPHASPRTDQELDPFDQFGLDFLSQEWTFDLSAKNFGAVESNTDQRLDCFTAFDMH